MEAGREPGSCCLPLAPAEAGTLSSLRVVPARGPAMGLSLAGPSGVGLGLRALRWLACVDPVTDAFGFSYRPSFDAGLGRCIGSEDATPGSRTCVRARALLGWVVRAGLPGAFWCASPFPVAALSLFFVRPPPGLGRPVCCVFFFLPFVCPCRLRRSLFSGLGCLGPGRLVRPPPFFFLFCPPPFFFLCSLVFCFLRSCLVCVVLGRGVSCCLAWPCSGAFFLLASVALCCLVLCRAVVRLLVPCCVVCFVAVLGSRLASSAAVACCCSLSVLGRGSVLSCRAACGPCAVVPCAVFLGASLFAAPLESCCVGAPVSLLSVRCSLAPLALAGVVCCCPLCSGVCCWGWLCSVVSWWLPVPCFGGAVPVRSCGSPPCGLVWCVWVLCSAVLYSVVLCCRVVVCCRALLSFCVVACACFLFLGAALPAVCVPVCFPVVGRLVVAPWSPVLCPVVLCCRVLVLFWVLCVVAVAFLL